MAAKHILALALLALTAIASPAFAQNAPAGASSPAPVPAPVGVQQPQQTLLPPVRFPSGVNASAEALAEQNFNIIQQTSLAQSVEALCKTNYGPPQICGIKPSRAPADSQTVEAHDAGSSNAEAAKQTSVAARSGVPVFTEQSLGDGVRSGVVRFADGHTEQAIKGRDISERYHVVEVSRDSLTLERDGHRTSLPLQVGSDGIPPATVGTIASLPPTVLIPAAPAPAAVTPVAAAKPSASLYTPDSPIPLPPPKTQSTPGNTFTVTDQPK